ncbi:hypothetical protein CDAR_424241 [Caerostris darwini]|uniref:Uncharacterized protein n=1 Tax=Caerostris darwini TaxID=1538125 RepID=A0AAV4T368_9ARAC|nr:hypothetical protein CDAR_424241 [Caerostris darwini]
MASPKVLPQKSDFLLRTSSKFSIRLCPRRVLPGNGRRSFHRRSERRPSIWKCGRSHRTKRSWRDIWSRKQWRSVLAGFFQETDAGVSTGEAKDVHLYGNAAALTEHNAAGEISGHANNGVNGWFHFEEIMGHRHERV